MSVAEPTARPATTAGAPVITVKDVSVRFGGIVALGGVSFEIREGEILGLIGPNGAGKTTLFNCLSRLYTPNEGDVQLYGKSILDKPPHMIAGMGIGRTFQNVASFSNLSVRDNIRVGAHSASSPIRSRTRSGCPGCAGRSGAWTRRRRS